jgi:4'-phosphopantetheinyl transferase
MNPVNEPIHVFWLDLDLSSDMVDELSLTLSPSETQRVDRYTSALDQRRATVRLARRRQLLADFSGLAPQEVDIVLNSRGKPCFNSSTGAIIEMSSSQSGNIGLFAVTRQQAVGVDVESLSEIPESSRFASWVATTKENKLISALEPSERSRAYLRLWTRKEAYLKATGEGVGLGVVHFDVPMSSASSGQSFRPHANGAQWLLYSIPCPRDDLEAALVTSISNATEPQPEIIVSRC